MAEVIILLGLAVLGFLLEAIFGECDDDNSNPPPRGGMWE